MSYLLIENNETGRPAVLNLARMDTMAVTRLIDEYQLGCWFGADYVLIAKSDSPEALAILSIQIFHSLRKCECAVYNTQTTDYTVQP